MSEIFFSLYVLLMGQIFLRPSSIETLPYYFTDRFIETLNNLKIPWVAARNFPLNTSLSLFDSLTNGLLPDKVTLPKKKKTKQLYNLPLEFDGRRHWNYCRSLNKISDQSNCGSCWAFAVTEAISDRICIHSDGVLQPIISTQDLLSCCGECGGCHGGSLSPSYWYWVTNGLVSGGNYGEHTGCKSYSIPPCNHVPRKYKQFPACRGASETPTCDRHCDRMSKLSYTDDLYYGMYSYEVENDEYEIMLEIIENGPVSAGFTVYADFTHYYKGVYTHVAGERLGRHAVKILGWGVENYSPYWLAANSWNKYWGNLGGFFKILRGSNHCGIEENILAGIPDVDISVERFRWK